MLLFMFVVLYEVWNYWRGKLNTIDKVTEQANVRNDVVEDKRSSDLLPTSTTKQIINHTYYSLSYDEEYEQAEWVAYDWNHLILK
jgi:endonuclease G